MMSDEGPRLWASCALGMNDEKEIRHGIDLVREIASQFVPKEELDRSFTLIRDNGALGKSGFPAGYRYAK